MQIHWLLHINFELRSYAVVQQQCLSRGRKFLSKHSHAWCVTQVLPDGLAHMLGNASADPVVATCMPAFVKSAVAVLQAARPSSLHLHHRLQAALSGKHRQDALLRDAGMVRHAFQHVPICQ